MQLRVRSINNRCVQCNERSGATSFRCHSASFVHILVHSVPFLCLVLLWLILMLHWCHFTSLRCCSGSFWYIPVPFLSIPFHSGVVLCRCSIFHSVPFRSVPLFSNAQSSRCQNFNTMSNKIINKEQARFCPI